MKIFNVFKGAEKLENLKCSGECKNECLNKTL